MKLFRWIKHAYQRIKRGYSYQDLWSIYDWFFLTLPNMLDDFANEEEIGVPANLVLKAEKEHPELSSDERDELAFKEWREKCKQIAHHLREAYEPKEQINEFEDELFGWSKSDDFKFFDDDNNELTLTTTKDPELEKKWIKREEEIYKYQKAELKKGMEMLTENIWDLWW